MKAVNGTKRRTLILSVLVVVSCVALIAGATLAIFSNVSKFPFDVSSGTVEFEADVSIDAAWSQAEDSDRLYMDDVSANPLTITDENGLQMGTVAFADASGAKEGIVKSVSMRDIGKGVGVRFSLSVTNKSTIATKYIVYLDMGATEFAQNLSVTAYGDTTVGKDGTAYVFTQTSGGTAGWAYANAVADAAAGVQTTFSFEISLPWTATAEGSADDIELVVEAVQSNAFTGDVSFGGEEFSTLEEAFDQIAQSGETDATVYLGDGVQTVPADLSALENKNVTLVGSGATETTVSGTFTLPAGSSLTLSDMTYSSGEQTYAIQSRSSDFGDITIDNAIVDGNIYLYKSSSDASENGNITITDSVVNGKITYSNYSKSALDANCTIVNSTLNKGIAYRGSGNGAVSSLSARTMSLTSGAQRAAIVIDGVKFAGNCTMSFQSADVTIIDTTIDFTYSKTSGQTPAIIVFTDATASVVNTTVRGSYTASPQRTIYALSCASSSVVTFTDSTLDIDIGAYSSAGSVVLGAAKVNGGSSLTFAGESKVFANDDSEVLPGNVATAFEVTGAGSVLQLQDKAQEVVYRGAYVDDGGTVNIVGNASISAASSALEGNNLYGTSNINISENAYIASNFAAAIYIPNAANLMMTGGTVQGNYAGIHAKMGTISVLGGTVRATGEKYVASASSEVSGGSCADGSAIVLHAYLYNVTPSSNNDYEETGATNALNVTIGENVVLDSKNWNPITYYDWAKEEQSVTIDSGSYSVYTVATDKVSLARIADKQVTAFAYHEILLNSDINDVTDDSIRFYTEGQEVVFDLGGHTISGDDQTGNCLIRFCSHNADGTSNLTIRNGALEAGSNSFCAIIASIDAGELILQDLTISNCRNYGMAVKIFYGENHLTMENVTVNSQVGGGLEVQAQADVRNCTFNQSGVYDHTSSNVAVSNNGIVNIYGGKYTADNVGGYSMYVYNSGGTINVYGGTVAAAGTAIRSDGDTDGSESPEGAYVNIYGGEFSGKFNCLNNTKVTVHGAEGLKALTGFSSSVGDIVLVDDDGDNVIDIGGEEWTPIAAGTRSGNAYTADSKVFKGTFDGNGITLRDLTITALPQGASADYGVGLFGVVNGGTVKNLKFADVNIAVSGSECAGSAVGILLGGGTVENVTVESGTVEAVRGNGGVVGRMLVSGTIAKCTNHANIIATGANAGGIVGAAYYTAVGKEMTVSDCTNYGVITGTSAVGGIVGLSAANVSGCVNGASVSGNGFSVGGIVGEQQNYGSVTGCTNEADIFNGNTSADEEDASGFGTGGIIGWVRYSGADSAYPAKEMIEVCGNTNTGNVNGGVSAGGIVGHAYNAAVIENNINKAESISATIFAAGIAGSLQYASGNTFTEDACDISVQYNVSTTSIDSIAVNGSCKSEYAYNNRDAERGFVVANNYASEADKEAAAA